MARTGVILKALATAFRRDQRSLESVAGNNFFLVTAYLLREAGVFVYLLIALVLLFPLSTDPLRKIPASRLALWPLETGERRLLRLLSPWINPVSWLLAGLAIWAARGKLTFGLWGAVAGVFAATFLLSDLPFTPGRAVWVHVPHFPGPWNHLIRKNLREIVSTLDFYCALVLSLGAVACRVIHLPLPREAYLAITVLVVLALSSYAQSLFGLDGAGGLARYRLLPLAGWEILAAKDVAFLLVAIPLTLPLAPLAGVAAALAALAMGHAPTVNRPRPQSRWRFSTGAGMVFGLLQAAFLTVAASSVYLSSPLYLLPVIAVWAATTWFYGRRLVASAAA
ncbi:MAG TPA: hypothetical protein VKF41_01615 [Bryobacteraceae bacterium]|nr:hypothetical protein [Bryobacteraceae bacterium]